MALRSRENLWGAWAFLIGVVLAIVAGILSFGSINPIILGILVLLGLVIGFVNVSDKDVNTFLIAGVSLVIVSFAGIQGISGAEVIGISIGKIVSSALASLLVLLVPATIIVSLKTLFSIAQR